MNVQVADAEVVFFYEGEYLIDLVDRDTEFTFIVTGRYFKVATRHDVGTQAKAYRIAMAILLTKFVEIGKAVNVNDDAQLFGLCYFAECDPIGSIQDTLRGEASMEGQFRFIDGATVHIGAEGAYIFKNINIGQCLTGIKEYGIAFIESSGELPVLLFDLFCVVYVQWGAEFTGQLGQIFFCEML
jgi:hypothetical protein